jgi:hypothetical protein
MNKKPQPPTEQIRSTEDPGDPVRLLFAAGEQLPSSLKDRIVSLGSEAVPLLLEILADEDLLDSDAPGSGWAPVHATTLLADLGAVDSIEPMLHLLSLTEPGYIMYDQLLFALPRLGPAVLEPALRAYQESPDAEYWESICAVLSRLELKDDRIFSILVQQLERTPDLGAGYLADYGDPRALRHLSRAFDRMQIEEDDHLLANQSLIEIQAAIEDLGGALSPPQQAKFNGVIESRNQYRARLLGKTREGRHKLGRNDTCWCGSGKKYKKCHLEADQRDRTAAKDPE